VGANTWASKGAAPAPEGSAGLRYFELKLPDAEARAALIERARAAGAAVEESEAGALVKDPSGNGILI
jgi:catechol 2,3-dioxygenase